MMTSREGCLEAEEQTLRYISLPMEIIIVAPTPGPALNLA